MNPLLQCLTRVWPQPGRSPVKGVVPHVSLLTNPSLITCHCMSLDLAVKHTLTSISPEGQKWESTGTTLTMNAPTAVGYTTHLLNVQSLLHKHSTTHRASRQLLSQYLQSLKKACPPLASTQSAQSSLYPRGQGSPGPN
jgi:hypothetical protein